MPPSGSPDIFRARSPDPRHDPSAVLWFGTLTAKGIAGFTPETIVEKIADNAKLSAREVYDIIMTAPKAAGGHAEGKAGGGLGWKTLTQFCADEGLSLEVVRAQLVTKKIKFDDTMTLRDIASSNGQKPYDLVESLRAKP